MSVKSMIRPALQALGLAAFFAMSLSAQAAPATLSFSSDTGLGDGVASDGDGGSVDIPSKSIEVLNIADTAGTSIGAIHWRGPGWGIPSALTYDDGLSGTTKGMAIRAGYSNREMAASLLVNSDRPLQGVADILGFSSLSAFAHWFRRKFAQSASAYRNRHAGAPHRPAEALVPAE